MHNEELHSFQYSYCVCGHWPFSSFYLKQYTTFRRLDSVSVFRWNLLIWAQSVELVPISGHQHQHKTRYVKEPLHTPSTIVKADIKLF
jgi:hypothetical protein